MNGFALLMLLALSLAESLKVGNCEYKSVRSNVDAEVLYEPTTIDECSQYCTRNATCTGFRHENSFCSVVTEDVGTHIDDAESGLVEIYSKLRDCQAKPKSARELFGNLYDSFEVMIGEEGLANAVKTLLNSVKFEDLDVDDDDLISHSERDPMVKGLLNLFETVLFKESQTIEEVREFVVFPVVDVSELEGSDLDWACEHVFGMQDFDVQAEDEMNVSAQEFSRVVNEFLHAYLENVDISDWDSIAFAKAQMLSLNQIVIPEQCQNSERRNLGTSCSGWSNYRYVCGDDSQSGHGWSGDYTAKQVQSISECYDWCQNSAGGCCEYRENWCLFKPTGVMRYSYWHTTAKVSMCSSKDYMCILGQGSSGFIASTNLNNAQQCGDLCKKINGCVRFDFTMNDASDACRLYNSEWRDFSSKGSNRFWCKEAENRCVDSGFKEWGILRAPQVNYWACCAGCPSMRGVSKYDTCNWSCGCICSQN